MAYYAIGERGSEGHARDQLATPSMHWVTAVQKSHPNAMVSLGLCWMAQSAVEEAGTCRQALPLETLPPPLHSAGPAAWSCCTAGCRSCSDGTSEAGQSRLMCTSA